MGAEPAVPEQANLFRQAASGDPDAMREIYGALMDMPRQGVCSWSEATCGAEIIARLIAAGGRSEDRMALAGLLLSRAEDMKGLGRPDRAQVYVAEAIGILDRLADERVEFADQALLALCDSEEVSAEAIELAKNWTAKGGVAL